MNKYDLSGEYGIGWTSNTNNEFYFDLEDYDKIKDYTWRESVKNRDYHVLLTNDTNTGSSIKFHHLLGYKGYDHGNRNPLDNRKNNLRVATYSQNAVNRRVCNINTSGFIGICWSKLANSWTARITVNGKRIHLGYYKNKEDAIKARLKAEYKYFGEFSPQKHLFEEYGIKTSDIS